MEFSVESLLKAVDNENNESILNLSSKQIKQEKNDILQKLGVKGQTLVDLHKRLKEYRFIDGLENLNFGSFVRWINISDPTEVYITNGGYVCEMTATDDTVMVRCKNVYHQFFQFDFNSCLVFQKLSNQERVLLYAMDNLVSK
jgi:hypothetical protein